MALLSGWSDKSTDAASVSISPDAIMWIVIIFISIGLFIGFVFAIVYLIDMLKEKKKYYKKLNEEKRRK